MANLPKKATEKVALQFPVQGAQTIAGEVLSADLDYDFTYQQQFKRA